MSTEQKVYVGVNAGSSSLKVAAFDAGTLKEVQRVTVERIGTADAVLVSGDEERSIHAAKHSDALRYMYNHFLQDFRILKVAHRIVHGGRRFNKPTTLTPTVMTEIEQLSDLAPLHNPINLACARAGVELMKTARHYGVFDTAAYDAMPDVAKRYAVPAEWQEKYSVQKFGFHGPSHAYAANAAAKAVKKPFEKAKIITVHLGSGASITSWSDGIPQETSMGFSPLSGLVMATRTGDIDPIVAEYVAKKSGKSIEHVIDDMWHKSGLLGMTGWKDMRTVLAAAGHEVEGYTAPRFTQEQKDAAEKALETVVHRLRFYISAYAGLLGKVDAIAFTGTIGERSKTIRQLITKKFTPLVGVKEVVVPTNEELAMIQYIL